MIDGNRRAIALDELFLEGLHTMLGKLVYERRCVDHTRVLDAYFGLGRGSKPSKAIRDAFVAEHGLSTIHKSLYRTDLNAMDTLPKTRLSSSCTQR